MPLDFFLRLNGRDVAELDAEPFDPVVGRGPGQRRNLVTVPGRMGVRPEEVSIGRPQVLALSLALSSAVEIEDRQDRIDAILAWVRRPGLTEIQLGTAPHRVWWGMLQSAQVRPRWDSVAMMRGSAVIEIAYLIASGTSEGRALTVLGLEANAWTPLTGLGTVPAEPLIFIPGGVPAPVIEVARADRSVASRLELEGQIPAGGWWELDVELRRVIQRAADGSGARVDHTATANPSGAWPVIDPAYGLEAIPPVIRSSRPAVVYYRPRWWIG